MWNKDVMLSRLITARVPCKEFLIQILINPNGLNNLHWNWEGSIYFAKLSSSPSQAQLEQINVIVSVWPPPNMSFHWTLGRGRYRGNFPESQPKSWWTRFIMTIIGQGLKSLRSCVRESYQSFPSKLLNTVKVSLFWDNHSSVSNARSLSTDLSQGLTCRSGSSPSSGDRCPLDKRCLDKNPSASTSSEVFREVNTPSMSLLLYLESLVGFLVMVVWWDVVEATLIPVPYQTKLNNHIQMELNLNLALTGA